MNDDYAEYYGDTPELEWIKCPDCDIIMDYSAVLHKFKCPCCGKEISEDDYYEYYDDDGIPFGCQACGGPYPLCVDGCSIFDD